MRRIVFPAVLVLGLLLTAFAGSTSAARGGVAKHKVDLTWKVALLGDSNSNVIIDELDSFGAPFGEDKPVFLKTGKDQIGEDPRTGRWELIFKPAKKPQLCQGRFTVDVTVITTTDEDQTVGYDGSLFLEKCTKGSKFGAAKPARLDLSGETTCRAANDCKGGLRVTGTVKY